jgi:hypothetical protein
MAFVSKNSKRLLFLLKYQSLSIVKDKLASCPKTIPFCRSPVPRRVLWAPLKITGPSAAFLRKKADENSSTR